MRKKGKPNPEQKYFLLVVALEAVYLQNNSPQEIPLCALATEKIIVRASNPGLFEPEQEISWSKNPHNDTVYHLGKVGVGTDASKEMLTVQGNIQVRETFDVRFISLSKGSWTLKWRFGIVYVFLQQLRAFLKFVD